MSEEFVNSSEHIDESYARFVRELSAFSQPEFKEDASTFILLNPTPSDIQQTARDSAKVWKLRDKDARFRGFRAIRLQDSSGNVLCFLWPSFCWTHHQVLSAAKKAYPTYTPYVADTRFHFKKNSYSFETQTLDAIAEYVNQPLMRPVPNRSVREE